MRSFVLLLAFLSILPLTGCGGGSGSGDGGGKSASPSTPTTWAADLTTDTMGVGFGPIGETDTTATVAADGTVDIQTVKFGHLVKTTGSEWTGDGPVKGYLLRLTYDPTAKTIEVLRVVTGQRVLWTLTAIPSGAG